MSQRIQCLWLSCFHFLRQTSFLSFFVTLACLVAAIGQIVLRKQRFITVGKQRKRDRDIKETRDKKYRNSLFKPSLWWLAPLSGTHLSLSAHSLVTAKNHVPPDSNQQHDWGREAEGKGLLQIGIHGVIPGKMKSLEPHCAHSAPYLSLCVCWSAIINKNNKNIF